MGHEIVLAIEDSRLLGSIPDNLNSTYLTLIPKVDRPSSFADYRPIALCNLLYKVVTKIIVGHMKETLGRFITQEQFGFLPDRQILDVAGIVQETIHSIKQKKLSAMVLKLDLEKAYDKVDRTMLHLILLQIGIPLKMTNWIMSCVNSTSYAVPINGSPSQSFNGTRGLR